MLRILRSFRPHRLVCTVLLLAFTCAAAAQPRLALVVGNATYATGALKNPTNDADAMTERLRALGFDVTKVTNADKRTMERALSEFAANLSPHTTGVFYYAGHGVQSGGRNYLIPIDASLESESSLGFEAVDVGDVLESMRLADNRINIVILDACRNNPFERRFRGSSSGLAAIRRGGWDADRLRDGARSARGLMARGETASTRRRCFARCPFPG